MPSPEEFHLSQPPEDISFFPFSGGCVLFKAGTRRLWVLNHTAAVVWCLLDEAAGRQDLIDGIVARFKVAETTAARDITEILRYFDEEVLRNEGAPAEEGLEETEPLDLTPKGRKVKALEPWPLNRCFRTPSLGLEFCSEHIALGKEYCSVMNYLGLANNKTRPDAKIWVVRSSKRESWDIALNGQLFFEGLTENELLPHAFMLTFALAARALDDKLLFHAAVLGRAGKVVIFPGETGTGKTTLAAVLARQGWQFFSDELAVMDSERLTITSFPLPMSIKTGAVPIIEPFYPGLGKAGKYLRPDGKIVRYLAPPLEAPADGSEQAEIAAIIFPFYQAGSPPRLTKTAKIIALRRLARTGSSQRELLAVDVQALITVIEDTPCYDMFYADIQQAALLLEKELNSYDICNYLAKAHNLP